jgi:hypothetical protein
MILNTMNIEEAMHQLILASENYEKLVAFANTIGGGSLREDIDAVRGLLEQARAIARLVPAAEAKGCRCQCFTFDNLDNAHRCTLIAGHGQEHRFESA